MSDLEVLERQGTKSPALCSRELKWLIRGRHMQGHYFLVSPLLKTIDEGVQSLRILLIPSYVRRTKKLLTLPDVIDEYH